MKHAIGDVEALIGKMSVRYGNKYDYLDMKININGDKKLENYMQDWIREIIKDFVYPVDKAVTSPATRDLMQVSSNMTDKVR